MSRSFNKKKKTYQIDLTHSTVVLSINHNNGPMPSKNNSKACKPKKKKERKNISTEIDPKSRDASFLHENSLCNICEDNKSKYHYPNLHTSIAKLKNNTISHNHIEEYDSSKRHHTDDSLGENFQVLNGNSTHTKDIEKRNQVQNNLQESLEETLANKKQKKEKFSLKNIESYNLANNLDDFVMVSENTHSAIVKNKKHHKEQFSESNLNTDEHIESNKKVSFENHFNNSLMVPENIHSKAVKKKRHSKKEKNLPGFLDCSEEKKVKNKKHHKEQSPESILNTDECIESNKRVGFENNFDDSLLVPENILSKTIKKKRRSKENSQETNTHNEELQTEAENIEKDLPDFLQCSEKKLKKKKCHKESPESILNTDENIESNIKLSFENNFNDSFMMPENILSKTVKKKRHYKENSQESNTNNEQLQTEAKITMEKDLPDFLDCSKKKVKKKKHHKKEFLDSILNTAENIESEKVSFQNNFNESSIVPENRHSKTVKKRRPLKKNSQETNTHNEELLTDFLYCLEKKLKKKKRHKESPESILNTDENIESNIKVSFENNFVDSLIHSKAVKRKRQSKENYQESNTNNEELQTEGDINMGKDLPDFSDGSEKKLQKKKRHKESPESILTTDKTVESNIKVSFENNFNGSLILPDNIHSKTVEKKRHSKENSQESNTNNEELLTEAEISMGQDLPDLSDCSEKKLKKKKHHKESLESILNTDENIESNKKNNFESFSINNKKRKKSNIDNYSSDESEISRKKKKIKIFQSTLNEFGEDNVKNQEELDKPQVICNIPEVDSNDYAELKIPEKNIIGKDLRTNDCINNVLNNSYKEAKRSTSSSISYSMDKDTQFDMANLISRTGENGSKNKEDMDSERNGSIKVNHSDVSTEENTLEDSYCSSIKSHYYRTFSHDDFEVNPTNGDDSMDEDFFQPDLESMNEDLLKPDLKRKMTVSQVYTSEESDMELSESEKRPLKNVKVEKTSRKENRQKRLLGDKIIDVDFEIPPLHKIFPQNTFMPPKIKEIINERGIPMKTGKFLSVEDKQIKENWDYFVQKFGITDGPMEYFRLTPDLISKDEKKVFLFHLGRFLPERNLGSIFKRFKRLFTEEKGGKYERFTKEEDKIILEMLEEIESQGSYVVDIATRLNRTKTSVERRIVQLKRGKPRRIKWKKGNAGTLIKALLKITRCTDVEQLKYRHISRPEWDQLSNILDHMPVHRLRVAWYLNIHPRLFLNENFVDLCEVKKKLIRLMSENNETEWKLLNWKKYVPYFDGFTTLKLFHMFHDLVKIRVPKKKRHNLKKCLKILNGCIENGDINWRKYLTKMMYEDGKVTEITIKKKYRRKKRRSETV